MAKKSHIIGTKSVGHDQSFCYLKDGEIVFFCEEERFNRFKKSSNYTSLALQYLVKKFDVQPDDEVFFNNYTDLKTFLFEHDIQNFSLDPVPQISRAQKLRSVHEILTGRNIVYNTFGLGFKDRKVLDGVEHHLLHASSGFFPSPFESAAILSLDGSGDGCSAIIAHGQKNRIGIKHRVVLPNSLGNFYSDITIWLGLGNFGDEGKTMGAASYGDYKKYYDVFRKQIIDFDDDGIYHYRLRDLSELDAILGARTGDPKVMTQRDFDIAATTQKISEEILIRLATFAKKLTGEKYLAMAGGVALNSVANGKILQAKIFDDIWIQPAANDSGLSIGGALWNYYVMQNHPRQIENGEKKWWIQEHIYWGPEFTDAEIESALKEFNLPVKKVDSIEKWTAERLAENKVVGWFQGKMEAGPRALGNRSILANPTHPDMQNIVNNKVKFREAWRPFAPSVLEEDSHFYFTPDYPSPFMILVHDVRPEWQKKLPAITHVDGTARVQTVMKKTNPRYYKMIEEFKKLSGVGMVLNTSFNLKGEPVVMTPRQAIIDFLRTQMDALVLHDYVLEKGSLGDYKTEKIFARFEPIEDNILQVGDGSYLLIDYTESTDAQAQKTFESFLHQAQFRNINLQIIPMSKQSGWYENYKYPFIKKVHESFVTNPNISLENVNELKGVIMYLPASAFSMVCFDGMASAEKLRFFGDQLLGSLPHLDVKFLDAYGVFSNYKEFVLLVGELGTGLTQFEAMEKQVPQHITQTDLYKYVLDVKGRFKQ